ncbi:MAG: mechanosensitive ion channel family protein [Clostridia bacterium]|nr:mechanosensitive ion channel family protein [Clostridia bacterium]
MDIATITDFVLSAGVNLLKGLLILVFGFFFAHWLAKLPDKSKKFAKLDPSLRTFFRNLLKLTLYTVVILTAANVLGVPLTSVLTLFASAGVAISLAMQGALSNLVGGLTLLILKPIKSGEFVKIGDYEGTVLTIGAFYTDLRTFDNRHISLPNNTLTNTAIVNYTREGTRRVDMTYSVSYASDLDMVYAALNRMIGNCASVLPDPAPTVVLQKCADSSVDFTVRAWVKAEDYWNVYFYMTDAGKRALDEAGIEIPFPQMDVHIR